MNLIEFENIIRHIMRHHSSRKLTNYKQTYKGKYKGKDVVVILTDEGMCRYIYMNGLQYFTTYVSGQYQKGVRII